jgi:hypothetical protein
MNKNGDDDAIWNKERSKQMEVIYNMIMRMDGELL